MVISRGQSTWSRSKWDIIIFTFQIHVPNIRKCQAILGATVHQLIKSTSKVNHQKWSDRPDEELREPYFLSEQEAQEEPGEDRVCLRGDYSNSQPLAVHCTPTSRSRHQWTVPKWMWLDVRVSWRLEVMRFLRSGDTTLLLWSDPPTSIAADPDMILLFWEFDFTW